MDDMARDIKFNLQSQSNKLENSTLKNLYEIQKDTVLSSRLIKSIQAARLKNKLILCGIITMLILSCLFIMYMAVAPHHETVVDEVEEVKEIEEVQEVVPTNDDVNDFNDDATNDDGQ